MKPTRQERALAACIEYDALMTSIADLTQSIGNALGQCPNPSRNPSIETHLADALRRYYTDGEDGPEGFYLSDEEKRPILDQCSHCSIAYDYIQQRRAAKKRLGIVKRQIRFIGRSEK